MIGGGYRGLTETGRKFLRQSSLCGSGLATTTGSHEKRDIELSNEREAEIKWMVAMNGNQWVHVDVLVAVEFGHQTRGTDRSCRREINNYNAWRGGRMASGGIE